MDAEMQPPKRRRGRPTTPKAPQPLGGRPAKLGLPAVIPKDEKPPVEKDEFGRFAPGNNGGYGRPPGAKNKLSEDFIEDFHEAWLEGGKKALKHMAENDPSGFVKCAAGLMPKDVLVEARGAGLLVVRLTPEDLAL